MSLTSASVRKVGARECSVVTGARYIKCLKVSDLILIYLLVFTHLDSFFETKVSERSTYRKQSTRNKAHMDNVVVAVIWTRLVYSLPFREHKDLLRSAAPYTFPPLGICILRFRHALQWSFSTWPSQHKCFHHNVGQKKSRKLRGFWRSFWPARHLPPCSI